MAAAARVEVAAIPNAINSTPQRGQSQTRTTVRGSNALWSDCFHSPDLDSNHTAIRHDVRLLDSNQNGPHSRIRKTLCADSFRQRFNEFEMAALAQQLCIANDTAIIEHVADALAFPIVSIVHVYFEPYDDPLLIPQFDLENPHACQDFQVAHENAARWPSGASWSNRSAGLVGHVATKIVI